MTEEIKPMVMLPYCICNANKLKEIAEKQGFVVEILKNSDEVPGLLDKYQPQYGLGVACTPEVEKLKKILESRNQIYAALTFDCSYCIKKTGEAPKIDENIFLQVLRDPNLKNGGLIKKIDLNC